MAALKRDNIEDILNRRDIYLNVETWLDSQSYQLESDLAGFAYSDFNRTGILSFWRLMSILEIVRTQKSDLEKDMKSRLSVTAAQNVYVNAILYEKARMIMPMKLVMRLAHVGKTAFSLYFELVDTETKQLYARCQRQLVYIDPTLRKVVPVPENIYQNFVQIADSEAKPLHVEDKIDIPENAITYSVQVNHSDTDFLYHTNQAAYIRFCMNAAASACNDDKLTKFSGDFFRYKVSNVLARYKGESFPGDKLDVTLWEDHNDANLLHFWIRRDDKQIFSAAFNFFAEPSASKL